MARERGEGPTSQLSAGPSAVTLQEREAGEDRKKGGNGNGSAEDPKKKRHEGRKQHNVDLKNRLL